jgi:hypothetical protein
VLARGGARNTEPARGQRKAPELHDLGEDQHVQRIMHGALATICSDLETNIFEFDFLSSVSFERMMVAMLVCI